MSSQTPASLDARFLEVGLTLDEQLQTLEAHDVALEHHLEVGISMVLLSIDRDAALNEASDQLMAAAFGEDMEDYGNVDPELVAIDFKRLTESDEDKCFILYRRIDEGELSYGFLDEASKMCYGLTGPQLAAEFLLEDDSDDDKAISLGILTNIKNELARDIDELN